MQKDVPLCFCSDWLFLFAHHQFCSFFFIIHEVFLIFLSSCPPPFPFFHFWLSFFFSLSMTNGEKIKKIGFTFHSLSCVCLWVYIPRMEAARRCYRGLKMNQTGILSKLRNRDSQPSEPPEIMPHNYVGTKWPFQLSLSTYCRGRYFLWYEIVLNSQSNLSKK